MMNENKSFRDGYIEGWKSIMGNGAAIPAIPAHSIPAGKTPFQAGIAKGVEAAMKWKSGK